MVHVDGSVRHSLAGSCSIHGFAAHDGAHDFDVFDLVRINVVGRISENYEVREFGGCVAALDAFLE